MELSRIQISKLTDGSNWVPWRYRMTALLEGSGDGLMEVVRGKAQRPEKPATNGGDADVVAYANYEKALNEYLRKANMALLLITTNISDTTLDKVIRFTDPKEVWDELHRLYDGVNDDRLYEVCMDFFKFKKDVSDDIATHLSKLKNLWHNLKLEISKADEGKDLPELLLICKILDTLPESNFSFKSSWMLMSKKDRTVENLTSQLCAHEKALLYGKEEGTSRCEALVSTTSRKFAKKKGQTSTGTTQEYRCHLSKEVGHFRRDYPKKEKKVGSGNDTSSLVLLNVSLKSVIDPEGWYVDNGATHHVTMREDLYEDFEHFRDSHKVTTADGKMIEAKGKGSIRFKARGEECFLSDVWLIPGICRNLFSVLAAQDKNPDSIFESRVTTCSLEVNKKVVLTGKREKGGLYKLEGEAVKPKTLCDVQSGKKLHKKARKGVLVRDNDNGYRL